ncbi:MAG TPA: FAD:protein FMN transferase [Sedimentisphaerales bacterium]|nr:FAD:protein FMN transferase [Sedimentisphaerales bacterium]
MTDNLQNININGLGDDLQAERHRFSHNAMATVFEIVIIHQDARYAGQTAWAAFDELDSLEGQLSRFAANSDIARINKHAVDRPIPVGPAAFECLQLCAALYAETEGAFDVTVGSLLDCRRGNNKTLPQPSDRQLQQALQRTGMNLVKLDRRQHTVQFAAAGVKIDLGGFGKGYAVDRMAQLLREYGIETALVHGGYSSVLAVGAPGGRKGWPVTISNPAGRKQVLVCLQLENRALSGSGLQKGLHIIDPHTGTAAQGKDAAWVLAPDAATADALSTAFMVMTADQVEQYCRRHPEISAMTIRIGAGEEKDQILRFGTF